MNRRRALELTATVLGTAILGSDIFLSGCKQAVNKSLLFSETDTALMDEIGETILPDSDRSPGAKAAEIGKFMQIIVSDCYTEKDAALFKSGLKEIDQAAYQQYGAGFIKLSPQQRFDLLVEFDKTARTQEKAGTQHFYTMFKQLTIWGYFSSEIGQTKALRYNPSPGGYDGNTNYKPGDRAWVGPLSSID